MKETKYIVMKYVDMLLSMVFAVFVMREWWGCGTMFVPVVLAFGRIGLSVSMWGRSMWMLWYALIYVFLAIYDDSSSSWLDSIWIVVPLIRMVDFVCQLFTGQPGTFGHEFLYTSNKETGMLIAYIEYVWLLGLPLAYCLWLALRRRVRPSLKDFFNKRVAIFLCVSVVACLLYHEIKQYHQLSALWIWVLLLSLLPMVSKVKCKSE